MKSREEIARFIGKRINRNHVASHPWGYGCVYDSDMCSVYELPQRTKPIVAALGSCIVKSCTPTSFEILPDASVSFIRYKVTLNDRIFPGLIRDSKIMSYLLLPYLREVELDKYVTSQRLCVFTDKGQIFHNYPSRAKGDLEGHSLGGDIARFEESVVWDIPGRKFPSKNKQCKNYETYYPNLPDEVYKIHPISNDDSTYIDVYGNGGFGSSCFVEYQGHECEVSRFYQYSRDINANSFHFIGTGERNDKLNLIGTYRSNVEKGVRNCIFATSDGGRQWYCKYEFADTGDYTFQQGHSGKWGTNFGNPVVISSDYLQSTLQLKVVKRELVIPSQANPDPTTLFRWEEVSSVKEIRKTECGTIITTLSPHHLTTGNIIVITCDDNINTPDSDLWFINNSFTDKSVGNNKLFKIRVESPNSFSVFELVSASQTNIPCRHIHHINSIKDGWIIGTGEIYPNGWLLYFQNKKADTFARCNAKEEFPIILINTAETSVQRTMGLVLLDDREKSVLFASDHDTLERESLYINGRHLGISRGSTGVYAGLLSDIDDRNKFECVYESNEPCYFFQRLGNKFIFSGQRGDFALSDSNIQNWSSCKLSKHLMKYYGNYYQYYFFDNAIIYVK